MKYFVLALVLLSGCAAPQKMGPELPPTQAAGAPQGPRTMIVYVPQSDEAAATWLKWFETHLNLRMVIAMSPRFVHIAKDPALKSRFQALEKEGRLEFALQIPNAPILPLLAEDPPYGYTDDIVQLIAQSKAGFYKNWNILPKGLVLPYGAVSPRLLTVLERSGFTWIVAATGQAQAEGLNTLGSLQVWDGTVDKGFVRVWDERQAKSKPLEGWMKELNTKNATAALPRDGGVTPVPLKLTALGPRTWDSNDWSLWSGDPEKNSAWYALHRTREALEKYKNSGQASLPRLDAAFNEIYSAQNSNFYASAGHTIISPALKEEREHEFQATLIGIFRLMNVNPPEDLFTAAVTNTSVMLSTTSTSIQAESFADGREHVTIRDSVGDEATIGGGDVEALEVWTSTDSAHWVITFANGGTVVPFEIYVDLNNQPNAGTVSLLSGRNYFASAKDAWEYAIAVTGSEAVLYRTQGSNLYGDPQKFPVVVEGRSMHIYLPLGVMRGRASRWGYQMLVGATTINDIIDPPDMPQKEFRQSITSGNRHDFPFVRIRRN